MKQVYLARDRVDADLTAEALLAEGIEAIVKGDPMPVSSTPFPSVWVDDADEARARGVVEGRQRSG
jgi:hypothetical protein